MFFRGLQNIPALVNEIFDNEELSDGEKLRKLLKIEYLRSQVGVQMNHRLLDFLQRRDII